MLYSATGWFTEELNWSLISKCSLFFKNLPSIFHLNLPLAINRRFHLGKLIWYFVISGNLHEVVAHESSTVFWHCCVDHSLSSIINQNLGKLFHVIIYYGEMFNQLTWKSKKYTQNWKDQIKVCVVLMDSHCSYKPKMTFFLRR